MRRFGLIGRNISYSFSPGYFREKFNREGIQDSVYEVFDLPDIKGLPKLLEKYPDLKGLNVTIPYKEEVLPYLHDVDLEARQIGAVNTIRISENHLRGYNTDLIGFKASLQPLLEPQDQAALILGTGGASKAIAYGLEQLGISYRFVSRTPRPGQLHYTDLNPQILGDHSILVNCTPLGTHPDVEACPPIPYEGLSPSHLLYDLIYNPEQTEFLKRGGAIGARTKNGLEMLQLQADASWELWNS